MEAQQEEREGWRNSMKQGSTRIFFSREGPLAFFAISASNHQKGSGDISPISWGPLPPSIPAKAWVEV